MINLPAGLRQSDWRLQFPESEDGCSKSGTCRLLPAFSSHKDRQWEGKRKSVRWNFIKIWTRMKLASSLASACHQLDGPLQAACCLLAGVCLVRRGNVLVQKLPMLWLLGPFLLFYLKFRACNNLSEALKANSWQGTWHGGPTVASESWPSCPRLHGQEGCALPLVWSWCLSFLICKTEVIIMVLPSQCQKISMNWYWLDIIRTMSGTWVQLSVLNQTKP